MKTHLLPAFLLTVLVSLPAVSAAETANEILATPEEFRGETVTLEVAMLRPVRWQSPVENTGFALAMTADRRGRSYGGEILLAFPEEDREDLMKKYGVTRDARPQRISTKKLKGTFVSSAEDGARGVWFLDLTDGKVLEELADKNEQLRSLVSPGRR